MDAKMPLPKRLVRRPLAVAIQGLSVATASSLLLWSAGGGFDVPQPKVASAATKPEAAPKSSTTAFPSRPNAANVSPADQSPAVKLNYFSAPWEKVFKDVAEATESKLIMDRVPAGRYSRRDATEYNRHDAIRILNKDIEPLGFRLIEKGDFLIVLDLPSQRPRYQPAVVSKQDNSEKVIDPNRESSTPFERRVDTITKRDAASNEAAASAKPQRSMNKSVRQVSHDDETGESANQTSRQVSTAEAAAPARLDDQPAASAAQVVFRPKHRTVVDLSKQIYRAFKPRAQLVSAAGNGLPAFRIESAAAAAAEGNKPTGKIPSPVTFTVAIDEASDELLIDGRKNEVDAVLKLLRTLDRPFDIEDPLQLVASTKYVCQIAHQLPAEIERIQAARKADRVAKLPVDQPLWVADGQEQPVPRGDLRDEPQVRRAVPSPIGAGLGNIKGEVKIESVPDLGALIIRGNERDVEEVMRIIRQLEELSEATAPKVDLHYLKHVDAESLAELLTTVYERLTKFASLATQPRQSVSILPINKPNSLMIIAPQDDMDAIIELIEQLDKPVDPATEFQVFRLKSAIATEVAELITTFYEERENLGAKVLVIADPRSNSVIVRAQARDLDEISSLIRKVEKGPAAVNEMKIFPLKNAVATELAAVMNAAIQSVLAPPTSGTGGGGGGQFGQQQGLNPGQVDEQFTTVKSAAIKFLLIDGTSQREFRSGILADIRITPDMRANSLIVTASEQSMNLISELIKQLDRPTSTVSEIKVFTLANADAELMVQQLNALFNNQAQGGAGNRQQQGLGIALAGADDASSSLVPLKFSIDKRTNSIIAVGSADALKVVEAILLRLDESDLRARQTIVLRLQNSPAAQVATEINQFFTAQRDLTANDPNLVSSIEQLERDVVVVADTATNSLIISATPRYFEDIKKMVAKLDEPPRQVIIQALLVEVELANTDEFGVELGFQDSVLFDRSFLSNLQTTTTTTTQTTPGGGSTTTQQTNILSQEGTPGFNFNNAGLPLGNNTSAHPSRVGTQGLSNFSLGRINGDLGFGGLVLSAGSESVNVLLRALSAHRKIQILSRPQIRALDNIQAEIFSGQKVPTITSFQANGTTGVNTPVVTPNDVGIQLTCVPRVTEQGQVFMQVFAQRSQYRGEGVPISTDVTGRTIESPILDISRATTTISVQTGQTVVIGGLINTRDENFTNKVPFLGDIPWIGTAFRYDSRSTRRVELLVFLTPRVIGGPTDEETIKEVEMGRLHFIECEAEEVHGPLRSVPSPDGVFNDQATPWYGPGAPMPTVPPTPVAPPASDTTPPLPSPPQPNIDPNSSSSVIRDSMVNPAGAARLRYTEQDDSEGGIQQIKAESIEEESLKTQSTTKSKKKSLFGAKAR